MAEQKQEKTWHIWTLSEGDIDGVAKRLKVKLTAEEKDEVARLFSKGISALLGDGYSWDQILEDGIKQTLDEAENKRLYQEYLKNRRKNRD